MKQERTNVMRLLDSYHAVFEEHTYPADSALSGSEVAKLIGEDPNHVFKTLVTVGNSRNHYVFVIPVNRELNLKKAAKAVGEKSIEMIKSKELLPLTGYIHGGCSPIGMKKGRQGILLSLICGEGEEERFASLIFKYTTTIGIRKSVHERFVLKRRTEKVSTPYGDIRVKRSYGYGVTREKYEYEDIARIARELGVSLRDSSGIRPQNDKEAAPSE